MCPKIIIDNHRKVYLDDCHYKHCNNYYANNYYANNCCEKKVIKIKDDCCTRDIIKIKNDCYRPTVIEIEKPVHHHNRYHHCHEKCCEKRIYYCKCCDKYKIKKVCRQRRCKPKYSCSCKCKCC